MYVEMTARHDLNWQSLKQMPAWKTTNTLHPQQDQPIRPQFVFTLPLASRQDSLK